MHKRASETERGFQISRRQLLVGGAALAGAGLLFREKLSELMENVREFELGKFHIRIHGNGLVANELLMLEGNLKEAYKRLEGYFGQDVLLSNHPQSLEVFSLAGKNSVDGRMTSEFMVNYSKDGQVREVGFSDKSVMAIEDVSNLGIVLHELFHIAIQWPMPNSSVAFTEGHADLIDGILCPESQHDMPLIAKEFPQIMEMLNEGRWDVTRVSTPMIANDKDMMRFMKVLRQKWATDWGRFLKEDSDFLKNFYGKIAELKKKNDWRVVWDYEGMSNVAKQMSSRFEDWRKTEGHSMQLPEISNPSRLVRMLRGPGDHVLVLNVGTRTINNRLDTLYGYGLGTTDIVNRRVENKGKEGSMHFNGDQPFMKIMNIRNSFEYQYGDQWFLVEGAK